MRTVCTLLAFLIAAISANAQELITGSIEHDGIERDYRFYIPAAYSPDEEWPLVFNFHGFGSNATQQEFYSAMNMIADTANFLICYPNGIGQAWNVGWDFGSTADDVGFVSALIDSLASEYAINLDRVYACGMSNGGFMSYRLACELNDKIAAIASVTGSISPQYINDCSPGKAVPVLEIHGTADDVVPYEGQSNLSIHIDTLVRYWAANNDCNLTPDTETLPNTNTTDQSTVTSIAFDDCASEREVLLYRVDGGGHTWPGAPFSIGVTNQDINASEEIWHFFNHYTLNGLVSTTTQIVLPEVNIFPNPTKGVIHFDSRLTIQRVMVYNALGEPVFHSQQPLNGQLDLSGLQAGVYFLEILSNRKKEVRKIVKR